MSIKCKYSYLYKDAEKSFIVNVGSESLRPIRISLPTPPPVHLIDGWGLHPDEQRFKPLEIPAKLKELQTKVMNRFSDKTKGVNGNAILNDYWSELEEKQDFYRDEIKFIKRFVWFSIYGYWVYIDGVPTYLSPWYFTYLNMHRITTEKGYSYPEYREKGRLRFLFRHYINTTTETFVDLDENGIAYKVADENGILRYRMSDTGNKLFVGTIEPKDRRGGLTNETCHIINRIATSQRGADKLATVVSMGGDNAETHFRKKLVPAWNVWHLFMKPVWIGGFGKLKQLEFTSNGIAKVVTLDTMINFTESGDDLANDGKMIVAALYDEQGKGKRTGNVQNRWQINKEAMSLAGGSNYIGFCIHPSTVEKMEEGGQDYKDMCDLSNFYQRKKDGQTLSGLALCYFRSSFCMEGYIDCFGNAVLDAPTERQIALGYKKRIGSRTYIVNKRKDLYKEDDPVKMDEFRSFVRKFPEDYKECWTGVAGHLGLDNEIIRQRLFDLSAKPLTKKGEFIWLDKTRYVVAFMPKFDGRWTVAMELPRHEANQMTTMMDYSAFEDDEIVVNRPLVANRFIVGVDPQSFSNKAEAVYLDNKYTKKSDTAISVLKRRDRLTEISEDPRTWGKKFVASFKARLGTSLEAAEEALKAAIYYGGLINIEINRTEVWERIIEQRFGGYLNYKIETLADGSMKRAPKPGHSLATQSKKSAFALLNDYIIHHCHNEPIEEFLQDCDQISSMEQLTKFDRLAAHLQALLGDESIYGELLTEGASEESGVEVLGLKPVYY